MEQTVRSVSRSDLRTACGRTKVSVVARGPRRRSDAHAPSSRCPSCNAPIVGTKPTDLDVWKAVLRHARTSGTDLRTGKAASSIDVDALIFLLPMMPLRIVRAGSLAACATRSMPPPADTRRALALMPLFGSALLSYQRLICELDDAVLLRLTSNFCAQIDVSETQAFCDEERWSTRRALSKVKRA